MNLSAALAAFRTGSISGIFHGPSELFLEVSAACQLRCRMCATTFDARRNGALNAPAGSGNHPFMTPKTLKALEPILSGVIKCYLMGNGEPLLNPHFLSIVESIAERGIWTTFNTNGLLLDREAAERLVSAKAGQVVFSIDSSDPDVYRFIRGASLARVSENLRNLVETGRKSPKGGPHIMIAAVVMRSNLSTLPDLIRDGAVWGASEFHLEPLLVQDDSKYMDFYREEVVTRDDMGTGGGGPGDDILKAAEESGVIVTSPLLQQFPDKKSSLEDKEIFCAEPWTTMFVTWNGFVRPCCQTEGVMGRLSEQEPQEIWRAHEYRNLRKSIVSGEIPKICENCVRNERMRNDFPVLRSLLGRFGKK